MARQSGFGENVSPLRRKSSTSTVVSSMKAVKASQVDVADLAHNPFNPAGRSETGVGLKQSITTIGVLNALVVVPADVWLRAHPDHEDAIGEASWVVIDGNRRLAGARAAGLDTVPIHASDEIRPEHLTAEAILHADQHLTLNPIEEATAFAEVMREKQVSQRVLAEGLGISQSHVAKRVALLRLPKVVQEAIEAGQIGPKAALYLMPGEERAQIAALEGILEDGWSPESALARAVQNLRMQDAVELARQQNATVHRHPPAGMVEVDLDHLDEHDLEGATLVVVPATDDDATGPTLGLVRTPERDPGAAHDEARRVEDRERRRANKAREVHLGRLVKQQRPRAGDLSALMQRVTVRDGGLNAAVADLAVKLLQGSGVADEWAQEGWQLRRYAPTAPTSERARLAWVIGLCTEEIAARETHRPWHQLDAEYLDLLRGSGYVPTEWELQRLNSIELTEEEQS